MEVYDRRNEHFGLNRAPSSEAREFDIWGGGSFKSGQGKYGYESGVPCFVRNNGGGACSAGTEVKK